MAINLTSDQIDSLKEAEAEIVRLHKELDKAESAGLNVDELRATLKEAETLRAGMLRVYGQTPLRRRG